MKGSPKRQKPEEELVLKSVPTSIPRYVTSLVLRSCGITSIPNVLLECTWLKKLDISINKLTELPDAVRNWTSLTVIDIRYNQLIELPETVGNWASLDDIDLGRNELIELPDAVGNWTSLQRINLWGNQLTELPEAVGNWTSLTWISFSYNDELIKLPEAVGNWTSLECIYLPGDMKCPRNAKDFIRYYSSRLRLKKEATLLYWALKKVGLPRDLVNLGRKAVWARRGV